MRSPTSAGKGKAIGVLNTAHRDPIAFTDKLFSQINRIGRRRFVGQVTKLKRGRLGSRDVASLARDMMLGSLRMNG